MSTNPLNRGYTQALEAPLLDKPVATVGTPVIGGVWIMGQVTEGGAWHQGAAGGTAILLLNWSAPRVAKLVMLCTRLSR